MATSAITKTELAEYIAGARARRHREKEELLQREERARQLAERAAGLLKDDFGATRVVLFGSLAHPGRFTSWSDVDIAAWGIDPRDTLTAIGAIFDLDTEISVNLVDVNACKRHILAEIEREGIPL